MGGKKNFILLQTRSGWYSCFYTALGNTSTTHCFVMKTHLKWTIMQHTTGFHSIKINTNHFHTHTHTHTQATPVLQFRQSYCNYAVMTKYFKVLPVLPLLSRVHLSKSMWYIIRLKCNKCQWNLCINPINTKRIPLYLKTQSVPRCKHFSSRL